jgi:hypothetical protein
MPILDRELGCVGIRKGRAQADLKVRLYEQCIAVQFREEVDMMAEEPPADNTIRLAVCT